MPSVHSCSIAERTKERRTSKDFANSRSEGRARPKTYSLLLIFSRIISASCWYERSIVISPKITELLDTV